MKIYLTLLKIKKYKEQAAEAMIIEYNGKKKSAAYRLNIRMLYERDVSLWVENDTGEEEFDSLLETEEE